LRCCFIAVFIPVPASVTAELCELCRPRTLSYQCMRPANTMEFQTLFESVCRCFGHTPASPNGPAQPSAASQPINDSGSASSVKRRTNRLQLDDEEWDELFDSGVPPEGTATVLKKDTGNQRQTSTSPNELLDTAKELAKAKLAANPSRYRPKRKRSGKSRDDIFRSKDAPPFQDGTCGDQVTPFSRLMTPSVALCFATPLREQDEPDVTTLKSCDASDTGTLNTCEDTITSTVFFDNKYSHIQETRPPMPLFNQFKLGDQENEIHTIVATDSHSSAKLIELLQQQNNQRQQPVRMDTGEFDHEQSQRQQQQQQSQPKGKTSQYEDVDMNYVPDVKAMSSSSTSRSSSSQSQKQQLHQF
jgi:hypothetical protein